MATAENPDAENLDTLELIVRYGIYALMTRVFQLTHAHLFVTNQLRT